MSTTANAGCSLCSQTAKQLLAHAQHGGYRSERRGRHGTVAQLRTEPDVWTDLCDRCVTRLLAAIEYAADQPSML